MLHDKVKGTDADATSDDMGSTLRVRSNLRAGTAFTCTPVAEPAAAKPAPTAAPAPTAGPA